MLTGKEQRSPTALKSCPKSFVVTEELVQEALANCPHLTLDDLKRETRLFRGNRFKNARLEWATTWLNWMETEDKKRSERAQSRVTGATTYRAERDARVAQAAPGIAAAAPAVRVPGSPLTVVEDVTDAQPRTPRIAQG